MRRVDVYPQIRLNSPLGRTLNTHKTESLRGGEDHVGFARDESALDRKLDFLGCVERSSGGQSTGS